MGVGFAMLSAPLFAAPRESAIEFLMRVRRFHRTVSNAPGLALNLRRRIAGYVRWAFRPRQAYLGWDPREPTLLGFALFFLVLTAVLPWWGVQRLTGDPVRPVVMGATLQFGPWLTTYFSSMLSPAGFSAEAKPMPWWEFPRGFSAHAAYLPVSASLCALWLAAFVCAVFAMWARRMPRRRLGGWPTVAELATSVLVLAAVLVAVIGFPSFGHYPSFVGQSDDGFVSWSPALGWYFAIGVVVLSGGSSFVGHRVDRKLRGVCWFCFRPVSVPKCDHCGSAQ